MLVRYTSYLNWKSVRLFTTSTTKPNILFFGTDLFAAQHLHRLLDSQVGRVHHVVTAHAAKSDVIPSIASRYGINLYRANTNFKMDDWVMPEGQFDLGVVVSFGYKIPSRIINQFPLGMVNVHPSLLPAYRGASPIQSVLLNNETHTGVCIIDIDPDIIDSGRILARREIAIHSQDTFLTLRDRLARIGSDLLLDTVSNLDTARRNAILQDDKTDTTPSARKLQKRDAFVDCHSMTADDIYRIYRALYGYLTIHCQWKGKQLLLLELEPTQSQIKVPAGDIIYDPQTDRLIIGCCSETSLSASRVQIATRKRLKPLQFAHGYRLNRSTI